MPGNTGSNVESRLHEGAVRFESNCRALIVFDSGLLLPQLGGRALRVVTLADRVTIQNAFLDRRFRP
jgi:hypothetical protein